MTNSKYLAVHDIGLVTSMGISITTIPEEEFVSFQGGTTPAKWVLPTGQSYQAAIRIAEGITSSISTETINAKDDELVEFTHNPMMAFWKRAKLYYDNRADLVRQGYSLLFDDSALIISDLGQSLYMLFGRHWNMVVKEEYQRRIGTPPIKTPEVIILLEKCYTLIGWDMANEEPILFDNLRKFIVDYYQDLIKHFEYSKFQSALQIKIDDLATFMEVVRESWLWLIKKQSGKLYSIDDPLFAEFRVKYAKLE
jgi:hypothetical protein